MISFGPKETDLSKSKDGGIIKRVLQQGKNTWQHPDYEASCTFNVKITGSDGTVYQDTFAKGEPITSHIGDFENTKGLDKALKSMSKKEKAQIFVKSEYAYGVKGNTELNIPPNSDLTYEIELVSFVKGKEDWGLSFDEKKEISLARKADGNNLFQKGHYRPAVKKYKRCLKSFAYEKDLEGEKKNLVQNDIR